VHAVHGGTVVAASAGMQPDANGKVEAYRTKVKLSFKYQGS
jgi:flavin-binding protein dodecin